MGNLFGGLARPGNNRGATAEAIPMVRDKATESEKETERYMFQQLSDSLYTVHFDQKWKSILLFIYPSIIQIKFGSNSVNYIYGFGSSSVWVYHSSSPVWVEK